jgi:glutamate racemase
VILGCTQYPLIKNSFNSFFFKKGINPTVFDPADEAVKEAEKKFNITGRGELTFFVSKDSDQFRRLVNKLFPNTPKHSIVVVT